MKKYLIESVFLALSIFAIIWIITDLNFRDGLSSHEKEEEVICETLAEMKFGLPIDSFIVESATIKNNQNLSVILAGMGVSYQLIDELARASLSVFDVRRFKANNNYYCFSTKDSLQNLAYFVYEIDPVDYVVYQLKDSLTIYKGKKPVTREIRTSSGTIRSSLWNALKDNNLNPLLASKLDNIYQWSIDFFGLQKGDMFEIVYEETYVDSVSIGISNVYACRFNHFNKDFYAFLFEQDSVASYYDENGKSLKKAFLKAPLSYSRISSHFSNSRMHPVLKIKRAHHGIDYAAPAGTPVQSIGDGVVARKGYQAGGGGNYLYIKHNSVYTTCYMHLNGYAKGMSVGTRVRQGELIGFVGSTGLSTGPHLDFRVFYNGTPIDPLKLESPPVEPVHERNMPQFASLKDSLIMELQLGNESRVASSD